MRGGGWGRRGNDLSFASRGPSKSSLASHKELKARVKDAKDANHAKRHESPDAGIDKGNRS